MKKLHKDDVNISMLTVQMEILKVWLKNGVLTKSSVRNKELPNPKNRSKQILVNPATSAAGERSFSTARRLNTWLRSRMNQERFSNLTVLNIYKETTDSLSTIDIANEFTDSNTNRKCKFDTFQVLDVQKSFYIIHLRTFAPRSSHAQIFFKTLTAGRK